MCFGLGVVILTCKLSIPETEAGLMPACLMNWTETVSKQTKHFKIQNKTHPPQRQSPIPKTKKKKRGI